MAHFFQCFESLQAFSFNPVLECPHCAACSHFVSHGFIYKKQSRAQPKIVGKRLCCSNRFGHAGCGRTVQLLLSCVIPKLCYGAVTLGVFIALLLSGLAVAQAYRQASGAASARNGWRWLRRFYHSLPNWRAPLHRSASLAFQHRSHALQLVLCTLVSILPADKNLAIAAWQWQHQVAFC